MSVAIVKFLTGDFPFSAEVQALGMAFQGAMVVRNGRNINNTMAPFHAFALSTMAGFGGGWLGFIWLGKPSSMLTSDINAASCIIAFVLANYLPFDIGYKLGNFLPITIVVTSCAQLFRAVGMMRFITVAMAELRDKATPYYPIPVFGPIIYGAMLGNMGGLFTKGFDGHLEHGMPFPFQNAFPLDFLDFPVYCMRICGIHTIIALTGLIMGAFFHFFVHDTEGPVGKQLRSVVYTIIGGPLKALDDRTFAMVFVSLFMQIAGILQLPAFFGPSYSPLNPIVNSPITISKSFSIRSPAKPRELVVEAKKAPSTPSSTPPISESIAKPVDDAAQKKKKKKKKKKVA